MPKFFAYDAGGEFQTFDTAEEAKAAAEEVLDIYADEAGDETGWHEEVETICWGEIIEQTVQTSRQERPADEELDEDGCDKDGTSWGDFQWIADYELLPVGSTENLDASSPVVEKAEVAHES